MTTSKSTTTTKKQKKDGKVVKDPVISRENARLREKPRYRTFRLHKRIKHHLPPLPGVLDITKKTFRLCGKNKKNLAIFTVVYGVLFVLLVRGIFNPININDFRFEIESLAGEGSGNSLSSNRLLFGQLVGSLANGLTGSQGIYQVVLLIIGALAAIWLFRQQQVGNKVTVKQAFYRGMYPLIPFTLVLYVLLLQLLPGVIGNFLYSAVINNGIATSSVEQFIWLLVYISLLLFSFYLVSSTVIALVYVTLPEMTPIRALKGAKSLVTHRRFAVFWRTTMLFVVVAVLAIALILPALFINALFAQIMFLLLSILVLPFSVGYIFVLYRELL